MQTRYSESTVWTNEQIAEWRQQVWDAMNPVEFWKWLDAFPDDAIVGNAHHTDDCPMRNYLNAALPHLDLEIGHNEAHTRVPVCLFPNRYTMSGGLDKLYYLGHSSIGSTHEVPEWVKAFMRKIDDRFMRKHPDYHGIVDGNTGIYLHQHPWPVTAQGAIEVLNDVLDGVDCQPTLFDVLECIEDGDFNFGGNLPATDAIRVTDECYIILHNTTYFSFAYYLGSKPDSCQLHFSLLSEVGQRWVPIYEQWLHKHPHQVVELDTNPHYIHEFTQENNHV